MPKVSVIIPCYNQGQYLDEAVNSVLAQSFQDFEIVVVNDGSTDEATNALLAAYSRPKTNIITTTNQGLAMARNNGIRASCGEYILPLDADDKIGPEYLAQAVKVLDENPNVGIVYSEAEYFGEKAGRWELQPYSFESILRFNMIFCSSFFRRADFDKTPGYNPNMTYSWEDWDLWLSLHELGRTVHKLPEVHFYYRIRADSMVRSLDAEKETSLRRLAFRNHLSFYAEHFSDPISLSFQLEVLTEKLRDAQIQIAHMRRQGRRPGRAPNQQASLHHGAGAASGWTLADEDIDMIGHEPSAMERFAQYVRTRSRNAVWVFRTKGVAGVLRNIMKEIEWKTIRLVLPPPSSQLSRKNGPGSAFVNKWKVKPPSPKPTGCNMLPLPLFLADQRFVRQRLQHIQEELRNSDAIKGRLHHEDEQR